MPINYEIKTEDNKYIYGREENNFILNLISRGDNEGNFNGTLIQIKSDVRIFIDRVKVNTKGVTHTVKEFVRVITIETDLKEREPEEIKD